MINTIIRKSVTHNMYLFVLTILLVAAGWLSFRALPIDAIPDITNVQVQIITPVSALTPDTIEANITYPIENAMNAVPGALEVRSITRYALSQVTVIFEEGTDIYRARQLVSEKLQSIELSEDVHPTLGPISTGLGEIYHYAIEAKKIAPGPDDRLKQLHELYTLQEWDIIPRLLNVKGVNEVNTIGGYPKEYYVMPRLDKMRTYGIHFSDIVSALKKNNFNTGGGYIQQTAEQLLIQGSGLFSTPADIRSVPVTLLENFQTITIGDIARVKPGKKLRTGAALCNGEETIIGSVFMLLGENSRTVSLRVADKIKEIKKDLPDWVEIKTLYNRSDLVNSTLDTVLKNLVFGALLVIIILFFLIGDFRSAMITSTTIPLALMGTFICMKLSGIPGSLMSLGALDFGIIIDGAVIVMDSCARSVSEKAGEYGRALSRKEIKETVIQSASDIRRAAGFGQLIIIIVFLPIFALTGIEGKMFKPMAMAFCFALMTAFLVSFTIIPALAGAFLSGKPKEGTPLLMKAIKRLYSPLQDFCIKMRKYVVLTATGLILICGIVFAHMGGEFIPTLDEGALAIQFIRPINITPDQSVELEKISEKTILEFDEVATVFSRLGTAEISTDPAGINHADTFVILKAKEAWPEIKGRKRTKDELADAIYNKLHGAIPGQRMMMTQPVELRFNELLEGVRSDISIKIFGDSLEQLEIISEEISGLIKKVDGAKEVETELRGKSPLLKITPKMNIINKLGISKAHVLNTIKIAIGGEQAGYIYEGVKKFPVIVRLPEKTRSNLNTLKQIPVGVTSNFTVPLSALSKIEISRMYISINRERSKRRTAVMINLHGRDTQSFVNEAKKIIDEKVKLPSGYYIEWGGNFKNLETARERLLIIAPFALLLIIFLIYSAFQNILQTSLIFLGIPFAMVGGIISLLIMGLPFSISAGIGFIALSGIAVLNGLVLISYLNKLKQEGMTGIPLIEKGSRLRLRAVMMTALTDILGFLPMMLATGTGAEVQKPLATVVVGGVISSTILTLIVVPILYYMLESRMNIEKSTIVVCQEISE